MLHPVTDIAAHVKAIMANASANTGAASLVTAGGTGDGTKVTGESIDRFDYDSVAVIIAGLASLTDTKTASFLLEYQDSADNSNWNSAVALYASTVVATGDTGNTNETFVKETHLNLKPLARWIRFNVTMVMSHTSTDVAHFTSIAVLGGPSRLPAA